MADHRRFLDNPKYHPRNVYAFTSKLHAPEREVLEREFGWTSNGIGDATAALINTAANTPDGLWYEQAQQDAEAARKEALNLDIPGCEPGVDYDPGRDPHNDCRDAYRHALWVALMAQRDPAAAKRQADAHERSATNNFNEHFMDLWSNREGLQAVEGLPKGTDPRSALAESMKNRRLLRNVDEALVITSRLLPTGVKTSARKDRIPSVSERIDALLW